MVPGLSAPCKIFCEGTVSGRYGSRIMSPSPLATLADLVLRGLAAVPDRLLVLGLCGAQGSGKSTLAQALVRRCTDHGIASAALSLDDLYKTAADRKALAGAVHPLLRTRGVPGTHDVALGLDVMAALERGEPALLPRFDKALDDRLPEAAWHRAPARTRLLVFEGWCIGARPQSPDALAAPINRLEREDDPHGIWRRHVNAALAGTYQDLFARIDSLVLLAAPSFTSVFGWRREQEQALRLAAGTAPGIMSDSALRRFVAHYERLTRHMLAEMPRRTDVLIELAEDRSTRRISLREPSAR